MPDAKQWPSHQKVGNPKSDVLIAHLLIGPASIGAMSWVEAKIPLTPELSRAAIELSVENEAVSRFGSALTVAIGKKIGDAWKASTYCERGDTTSRPKAFFARQLNDRSPKHVTEIRNAIQGSGDASLEPEIADICTTLMSEMFPSRVATMNTATTPSISDGLGLGL